jgi:hypothetical protein
MIRALLILSITTTLLGGCMRPAAVRDVAKLSMPVVVRIQKDGGALQERMAIQRTSFETRAAQLIARENDARTQADTVERDWRVSNDPEGLRILTVIRESDAALKSNPRSMFETPASVTSPPDPIDLSGLKKSLSSLDRLKESKRSTFGDLLTFADGVNTELGKLAKEAPDKAEQK